MKKRLFLALLVAAGSLAAWRGTDLLWSRSANAPTAPVRQGVLEIRLKSRGEFKAMRTAAMVAPTSINEVKIVTMAAGGLMIKEGDLVAELDTTAEDNRLKEQESSVKQVDAEVGKMRAQHRIVDEQEDMETSQARFDLERARLEVRKQEIVSEIEAGKARLTMATAERKLKELEGRTALRDRAQNADLGLIGQRRKKALADVQRAERNIEKMTLRAPLPGLLNVLGNQRTRGGVGPPPPYKSGDQAFPGAVIAEIPDLRSLVVELSIEETDRGKIAVGQPVRMRVDAVPDRLFSGTIRAISATAQISFQSWPPQKTFRALVEVEHLDPRLRPGMSADAEIIAEKLDNVILIPSRAAFDRGGRVIAYVRAGRDFEEREIVLGRKSEGQVEVRRGLKPGETVAVEEPGAKARSPVTVASEPAAGPAGAVGPGGPMSGAPGMGPTGGPPAAMGPPGAGGMSPPGAEQGRPQPGAGRGTEGGFGNRPSRPSSGDSPRERPTGRGTRR